MKFNSNSKDPTVPTRAEEEASMKQLEKYATQPNSTGMFKAVVKQNEVARKAYRNKIDRSLGVTPKVTAAVTATPKVRPQVKPRKETQEEFIMRTLWETSDTDMPKPEHMNDMNIVKEENWKKPPEQWDGYHNLSNDQKQQSVAWDSHLDTARRPRTAEERRDALDTKRMLNKTYNNPRLRKSMADDELKIINRHPSQLKAVAAEVAEATKAKAETIIRPIYNPEPEMSSKEYIRKNSQLAPGISEELIRLNADIRKNIDYVLGDETERSESRMERNNTNKEETSNDM